MGPALPRGLSTVVPVYNSATTIEALIDRIAAAAEALGRPFEVILVDDGSDDESWEAITRCARTRPWLRGINLMRNYGQHNALLCGVRAANYDTIATLDDDLQYEPEQIVQLLARLEQGYDVVYGKETERHHSMGHNLASAMLRLGLSVALGARVARIVSPLRVFRTRLRDTFANNRSPWVILDVFLCWGTNKFAAVEVAHHARADGGKTTYSLYKRLVLAFDLITGFSTLPLKVASLIGFFFTLFGMGLLAYVLGVYVRYGGTVPGWVFLASTIAIFSGAQMFALGIVGEYLARMFTRIMERPPYAVAEETVAQAGEGQREG
jgi:undecaprenyl-phosphate 4-deoxy-4-formamido-L-arabinose transferase